MLILAMDTSGTNCSCALLEDGLLLGEYNLNAGLKHSVLLMPLVTQLLDHAGKSAADISHLTVNLGPGSFTGLRIGLACAQAMAYALKAPLYGYSAFEVAKEPLAFLKAPILVLHDALKKTFYSAAYDSKGQESLAPAVRSLDDIPQDLVAREHLVVTGDALKKSRDLIQGAFPSAKLSHGGINQASSLARLAYEDIQAGRPPRQEVTPIYMRQPQAVREYEEKTGHAFLP